MKRYEIVLPEDYIKAHYIRYKKFHETKSFQNSLLFSQSNIYTNRSQNTLSTFYFNGDERITNKPLGLFSLVSF